MDFLIFLIIILFLFALVGGLAINSTLFLVLILVVILLAFAGRSGGRTWW